MAVTLTRNVRNIGDYNNYTYRVTVTENSQNILANTTNVTVKFEIRGYTSSQYSGYKENYGIMIDGTTVKSGSNSNQSCSNSYKTIGTYTGNVAHTNDGTKTIAVNVWLWHGSSYGDVTSSFMPVQTRNTNAWSMGNAVLTSIPRGSHLISAGQDASKSDNIITFDLSEGIPQAFYADAVKYVESFYDTLTVRIGNYPLAVFEDFTAGIISLSPSQVLDAYSMMSSVNSADWTFELVTKTSASGTQVGSSSVLTVQANISSDGRAPTLEASAVSLHDANDSTFALTGDRTKFISGLSVMQVRVSSASAHKEASLTNIAVNNMYTDYTADFVSDNIPAWSADTVSIFAEDSRGNQSTAVIKDVDLISYSKPAFGTGQTAKRTNNVEEETIFNVSGTWWNDQFGTGAVNTVTFAYQYKRTSESTYINGTTAIAASVNGNRFTISQALKGDTADGFDLNHAYDVIITASDTAAQASTCRFLIGAGSPALKISGNQIVGWNLSDEAAIQARTDLADLIAESIFEKMGINKVLWSGTHTSGNLTVPDSNRYKLFAFAIENYYTPVLVYKDPGSDVMRGWGGYSNAGITFQTALTVVATYTNNSDTINLLQVSQMDHLSGGSHSAKTQPRVSKIIGII